MKKLYPPQQTSHDALVASVMANGSALDSSDTGTGKTLKAVEIARTLGEAPIVVCPKAVIPAWMKTLHEQGVQFHAVFNYEKLRRGVKGLVSVKRRRFTWEVPKGTLIIFDEAHKCKGRKSLNAQMLIDARAQGMRTLLLSATAAKDPRELRAIGYALGLHKLSDFYSWAKRFGCVFNSFNSLEFPEKSRHHLTRLNQLIYPDRGHRLTRAAMGKHFAKTSINADPLDLGSGKEFEQIFQDLEDELSGLRERQSEYEDASNPLTRTLMLRQQAELIKIPATADLVKDLRAAGNSVAVFLNFNDSIDALEERLNEPVVFIRGGQKDCDRAAAIEAFQSNKVGIVIANVAAGGVGINLHDEHGGHPRVSLISPSYTAEDVIQSLGRVDRVGAQTDSVQRILVAANTFEERVFRSFVQKDENITLLHQQPVLNTARDMAEDTATSPPSPGDVQGMGPEEPTAKPAHAKRGPSSLKMYAACPSYKPRGGTNPAAEMGTRIHEALETGVWTTLSDFEQMLAQLCQDAKDSILKRHEMSADTADFYEEIRLTMDLGEGITTFGTSDFLAVKGTQAVKIDYKTGKGYIDPVLENWQAKAYTVGAFQKFPELDAVHFYFIVPQRDEILYGEFKRDDLHTMVAELRSVMVAANTAEDLWENAETGKGQVPLRITNPTDKVCNYCSNVQHCPAIQEKAFEIVSRYAGDDFTLPENLHASEEDSPDYLATLLRIAPIVEEWAKSVKHHAQQKAIEDGVEIPGYEIREQKSVRKISDVLAAYGVLQDKGIELDDFLAALNGSLPIGKFEDLIASTALKGSKKSTVTEALRELHAANAITGGHPTPRLVKSK